MAVIIPCASDSLCNASVGDRSEAGMLFSCDEILLSDDGLSSDKMLIIDIINNYEINPNKWVRLRRTNNKTTITVKHILNPKTQEMQKMSIQSVLETEMEVPSMEIGNSLLEQLGFSFRNYQEKERETYVLDGVEIDIDTWPMIPTYIEIENDSESKIKEIIEKLGLENNEIVSCNTEDVYKKYGIDLYQFRELRFEKK